MINFNNANVLLTLIMSASQKEWETLVSSRETRTYRGHFFLSGSIAHIVPKHRAAKFTQQE